MAENYVSFFRAPLTKKVPAGEVSVAQLHKYITTDADLRNRSSLVLEALQQGGEEAYCKAKRTHLPYVTPFGIFKRADVDNFVCPSGIIVVDIDDLQSREEAESLRDKLFEDEILPIRLAFVSPSGKGVKLFLEYNMPLHLPFTHFLESALCNVWLYLDSMYGVKADPAGKDVCRACLLCHDAGAKFRASRPYVEGVKHVDFAILLSPGYFHL